MKSIETAPDATFAPSELVLRPDGSIYHLGLHPHQVADTVLVAGDPARVERIASHFDSIEHRVSNREFVTITGRIGNKPITALSTGIGTDNIDIVINELDALRSVDLKERRLLPEKKPLRVVRIGTSGALSPDIEVGSYVHSKYAIGMDGVLHYYNAAFEEDEQLLCENFMEHTGWNIGGLRPYAVRSDEKLGALFQKGFHQGITATACGFYGPQGRILRLPLAMAGLNEQMSTFSFKGIPMANYEMESSALFGLGSLLGHQCTTVCLLIANRQKNAFLKDYKPYMERLITEVVERVSTD